MEDSYVMYLVVNTDLGMSPGKIAAQVGHAVMMLVESYHELQNKIEWSTIGRTDKEFKEVANKADKYQAWRKNCRKVVLRASKRDWELLKLKADVEVLDGGYTEIPPNSCTVLGFWPMLKSKAPIYIKKLQLL
jgi:PTH2 family peptidyl-tRNA hydrolase